MENRQFVKLASYTNADGVEVVTYHDTYNGKGAGKNIDIAGAMNCAKMEDKRQHNIARLRAKLAARKKATQ